MVRNLEEGHIEHGLEKYIRGWTGLSYEQCVRESVDRK